MEDSRGRFVPENLVKDVDKMRDQIVGEIVKKAQVINKLVAEFKAETMQDIEAFVALSAEKYGVKLGGEKGNVQLTSFDGMFKVSRAISENITFDERLIAAKQLIDECINEWSEGSRSEIRTLINQAWEVDKQGKINTKRILGLLRLDIKHEKWQKAMKAISDSITIDGTCSYIRIYTRNKEGKYNLLPLDVSAV